jgi:alanyl-tRNA synthetase
MHEALRRVLGDHVVQKGSLVDSERLRFDFSHGQAVTPDELLAIADIVNEQVRLNTAVTMEEMDMESAIAKGATALFGEKYGDQVRVLSMGAENFSVELCGGTHVDRTGDIGLFLITSESGVAAGIRRIEAVTGEAAVKEVRAAFARLQATADVVKSSPDMVVEKTQGLRAEVRDLEKEVAKLRQKLASGAGGDLTANAVEVAGLKVLASVVDGADASTLRETLDQCKSKLGSAVILLAAIDGEKIALVSGVTKDATDRIKAGDVMRDVAGRLGGKGGGRPDMAQGGGTDVAALPGLISAFPQWVADQLTP